MQIMFSRYARTHVQTQREIYTVLVVEDKIGHDDEIHHRAV
jgi:hypothetical protein